MTAPGRARSAVPAGLRTLGDDDVGADINCFHRLCDGLYLGDQRCAGRSSWQTLLRAAIFDSDYANPVSCKLSTRSRSRAVSS
jgi:hypothetical protein